MGGGGLRGLESFARRIQVFLQPRQAASEFAGAHACGSVVAGRSVCSAGQAGVLVRGMGRAVAGLLFAALRRGVAGEMEQADGQKRLSGVALGHALREL